MPQHIANNSGSCIQVFAKASPDEQQPYGKGRAYHESLAPTSTAPIGIDNIRDRSTCGRDISLANSIR